MGEFDHDYHTTLIDEVDKDQLKSMLCKLIDEHEVEAAHFFAGMAQIPPTENRFVRYKASGETTVFLRFRDREVIINGEGQGSS